MKFFDLLRLIIENLGRHRGRVLLTAIGVIIGTAAVVVLVSLGMGLQKSATENLWGIRDLRMIQVNPNYSYEYQEPGVGSQSTQPKMLTNSALEEIAALPGVQAVIPTDYVYGWTIISYGKLEYWSSIIGVEENLFAELELPLAEGEMDLRRGSVIIGSQVSNNYYDPNYRPNQPPAEPKNLLGQTLRLTMIKYTIDNEEVKKNEQVRVAGVLADTQDVSDWSIYVPMSQLEQWNQWFNNGKPVNRSKDGYQQVTVKATDVKFVKDISQQITEMGFMAYSPQSVVEGINNYYLILQMVFGGIGAIALLVAAIGIANTMTMAILERTHEIGLMKAVGATNTEVLRIFLGEAAGIGFLGGVGGALFGFLFSKAFNVIAMNLLASQMQQGGGYGVSLSTSTPPWLLFFAVVFATLIGLASGFFPAVNATRLEPVKALKYE